MALHEVPPELVEWVEQRTALLAKAAGRTVSHSDPREGEDTGEWLLKLLEDLTAAETIAKRAIHLLSAYALRTGTAAATPIARATDVTVTAAMNRASSKIARETWQEVWPEKR